MDENAAIEVDDLKKSYGAGPVLDEINFHVGAGSVWRPARLALLVRIAAKQAAITVGAASRSPSHGEQMTPSCGRCLGQPPARLQADQVHRTGLKAGPGSPRLTA